MNKKQEVIAQADQLIKDVPGFPKPGIIFKDIVPVFENPEYLQKVFDVMVDELKENNIVFDKIVCPEARGFLFGPALGLMTKKGVVMARKPGKLPRPGKECSYDLEYGTNSMIISEAAINPGEKVLVIDDLLATGGSAYAMCDLIKQSNATPVACLFLVELCLLKGAENIKNKAGVDSYSLVKYIDIM